MNESGSLAMLIDRVGRALNGAAYTAGLNPAQWAALRYFDRANRFSRTPGAFARYHATSPGTASQTVKALVAKGLLERRTDPCDARSRQLLPSTAGRALLERDPLARLERATAAMSGERRREASAALDAMLEVLGHGAPFGACGACRHLCREDAGDGCAFACVYAGERLEEHELDKICVNFAH